MEVTPCDIVAFTAHPDDAELTCGGTLALCARQGWSVGAVDFTRGELSTRGSPELRAEEARRAAGVLGLACRVNLDLPDGRLQDTDDGRRAVVRLLRAMRPKVVIAPPREDHHPDHMAVAEILARSFYLSGVARFQSGEGEPWRPHVLLHSMGSRAAAPSLVVDVTSVYDLRRKAIECYRSQFFREDAAGPSTRISHPGFLESLDGACRYYGSLIGVTYGEAFFLEGPVPVTDLVSQYSKVPWEHPRENS